MIKTPGFHTVLAAIFLSLGLISLGFILKSAALNVKEMERTVQVKGCLLYTSDAADE